jgi:peptidoglycan/LPS O-acetylase OafA/YrhL
VTWDDAPPGATASAKRAQIASLTGLRGFAALEVLLIHVAVRTEYSWLGIPDYGPVSLFVLSGFLLYRPWARWGLRAGERPSVRTFAYRRLFRIFPAYLVVLFVVALVYPASRPADPAQWLRAMTLTWIYSERDLPVALLQTWSLCTEVAWYVALPVLGVATAVLARGMPPRRGFWVSAGMLSLAVPISAGWRWWVHVADLGPFDKHGTWLPGYLFCLAGGALVAHLLEGYRHGIISSPWLRRVAADPWALPLLALAVVLVGTSPLGGAGGFPEPVSFAQLQVRVVCATVAALTLLTTAVLGPQDSPLNRILGTRVANAVGRWSYGIFLWHVPVIVILERDVAFGDGLSGLAWRLLVTLVISVPLGAATYAWVERPTIRWSRRRFEGTPPVRATAAVSSHATAPSPVAVRSDAAGE